MDHCIKIIMRKKKFKNAIKRKKEKRKKINIRTYTRTYVIIKIY